MFLEDQYESYVEDIRDTFEAASKDCEDVVSDLDSLAWEYDELLSALEEGDEDAEGYDIDRVETLAERFKSKIDDGASRASNAGSEIDYYDAYDAILSAVRDDLRDSGYTEFADHL